MSVFKRTGRSDVFLINLVVIFGCAGPLLLHGLFSSCGEEGLLIVVVHGPLIAVDFLRSTGSRACGLQQW